MNPADNHAKKYPFKKKETCSFCLQRFTLQETNISHLRKRIIIFKSALGGDMLVPRRVGRLESISIYDIEELSHRNKFPCFFFELSNYGINFP